MSKHLNLLKTLLLTICTLFPSLAFAAGGSDVSKEAIDVIWLATAAALVFFMQAGFALLESGMSRAKNCVNVVMKNYLDVCLGSLAFFLVGFGLMFGENVTGWIGTSHFAMYGVDSWDYSFLLFQMMFAATAVTITSGAMAERTHFIGYLIASVFITAFIYPIFGSWAWGSLYEGSGWLSELGFIDFAGSTVVHSLGGWCALAAIVVLGPRIGSFDKEGKPRDIPGHNLNFVALGGLILWFGWFGFNGGSTAGADVSIGLINLNTQLSAASGAVGALIATLLCRRPILVSTVVNGSLAGLVGITAGCASMEPIFACITGLSSGILAFAGERWIRSRRLDDVVGAIAVHGIAGAWGTLCAGLFLRDNLFDLQVIFVQLVGIVACFIWSFGAAYLVYYFINKLGVLRVSALDEQRGLDFTEHAEIAYPEFMKDVVYSKDTQKRIQSAS